MAVAEDHSDARLAGRFGTVVETVAEREELYPGGRVAVRLVIDELYQRLYWTAGQKPKPVWFKPSDLEKRT